MVGGSQFNAINRSFWLGAKLCVFPHIVAQNQVLRFEFFTKESAQAFADWANRVLKQKININSKDKRINYLELQNDQSQLLIQKSDENNPLLKQPNSR